MAPPAFSKSSDFGDFNVPSAKFCTFAVGKDKGLNFIGKSLDLALTVYRYHDASDGKTMCCLLMA